MKELRVVVKLYNNHLKEMRENLGLSQKTLSQSIGISLQNYAAFESLKKSPVQKELLCAEESCSKRPCFRTGLCKAHFRGANRKAREGSSVWKKDALKIAEYYGLSVEELFPDAILGITEPVLTKKLDAVELPQFAERQILTLPPSIFLEAKELQDSLNQQLKTLTPREEKVLRLRFGLDGEHEHTFEEAGAKFGISRTRIQQIERRALRRLRHPSRANELLKAAPEFGK